MKNKRLLTLVGSICLMSIFAVLPLLTACAAPTPTALPEELIFTSSPIGSGSNTQAVGLADLIMDYTPMKVTVRAVGGPSTWLPLFRTGESDLGAMNPTDANQAYLGLSGYEAPTQGKGYDFRYIQFQAVFLISVLVKDDSDIRKIPDLRGKKVPSDFGGNLTLEQNWRALLANGGLTYDDVIPFPVTSAYGPDVKAAFIEGRIDTHSPSIGSGFTSELDATVGVRYLPIDPSPEAVKRMREWYISIPYEVKAGQFTAVKEDMYVRAHLYGIVCRPDLSDDAVYEIAKVKWENHEELAPVHPGFGLLKRELFISLDATAPYHPGAIKFYKEIGVWTSEMEALQKKLLAVKK